MNEKRKYTAPLYLGFPTMDAFYKFQSYCQLAYPTAVKVDFYQDYSYRTDIDPAPFCGQLQVIDTDDGLELRRELIGHACECWGAVVPLQ